MHYWVLTFVSLENKKIYFGLRYLRSYLLSTWQPYIDYRICRERLRDEFGTVVELGNPSEIRLHVHGMLLVRISDIPIHVVYILFVMADSRLPYTDFTHKTNWPLACLINPNYSFQTFVQCTFQYFTTRGRFRSHPPYFVVSKQLRNDASYI